MKSLRLAQMAVIVSSHKEVAMTNDPARPCVLLPHLLFGTTVLLLTFVFGSLAGTPSVSAASCSVATFCQDAAGLFATSPSDGIPGCPSGQTPQFNPTGPGFTCTGMLTNNNNCLTNGLFVAGLFACPGQPIVLPDNGSLYPPAPPSWTYVPPAIAMASANTFPCGVNTSQGSNVAVNSEGCGGGATGPASPGVQENPVGSPAYSSFAPATAAGTIQPSANQSGGSQNDLGQLIATSLSQFFGANPGVLSSLGSSAGGSSAPAASTTPATSAPSP
jgi:hypothetical protein